MKLSIVHLSLIVSLALLGFCMTNNARAHSMFESLNGAESESDSSAYLQNGPDTESAAKTTTSEVKTTITESKVTTTSSSSSLVDLNDPNAQLSDWFTISSVSFLNTNKYPKTKISSPSKDKQNKDQSLSYERVNTDSPAALAQGAPSANAFWFRVRGNYLYYTQTKEDINVMDAIYIKEVKDDPSLSDISKRTATCINVTDYSSNNWLICATNQDTKKKWLCSLEKYLNQEGSVYCGSPQIATVNLQKDAEPRVETKQVTQPMIIIPMESRHCNNKWDYSNKGIDWECTCKTGLSQSPIDLPNKNEAILKKERPMFQYDVISNIVTEETIDGLYKNDNNKPDWNKLKIRYHNGAIRIYHSNLGKLVSPDGAVFYAEEIVFHTPSEHTINGVQYDLEMQVIHYGRSVGDIARQAVVSFLFKNKPGVYNKFLDSIDIFNLPNPHENYSTIENPFYIPNVFYTMDDDDASAMPPFSFYTYEGSLTKPPCSERTTHYVAADPIPLSSTVIRMFKEALRKPDLKSEKDEKYIVPSEDGEIENNRQVQPLNSRPVSIFDHVKFGCVTFPKKKKLLQPAGHYEKATRKATEYIFVNGSKPSNLPGAFVVSEQEAKGI